MVIIFGEYDDPHVVAVASLIDDYLIIDSEAIENKITIEQTVNKTVLFFEGTPVEASAIYWRNLDLWPFETQADETRDLLAYMHLFLDCFPNALWCNSPKSFVEHFFKYTQFKAVANQLPVLIPDTVVTNDEATAEAFLIKQKQAALKPVVGGQYTQKINTFTSSRDPVVLQQFIEGINIRTFVIGDAVFTAEIHSNADDFRTDVDCVITPIKLPAKQKQLAIDITQLLGYQWTAIDWIKSGNDYYFLEANFSPMFLHFEEQTKYPITESLVSLLIQFNSISY